MRRKPKPAPSPEWQRRREEHKALLRASRSGLDNLVEFTGIRNARGYLVFRVWSRTHYRDRYVVQSTDEGIPKHCTCEHSGICSHMGATWLFQHPGVKEVKPLPEPPRTRQRRPQDRDHSGDPESFAPEVGPIPTQYAGSKRTIALL